MVRRRARVPHPARRRAASRRAHRSVRRGAASRSARRSTRGGRAAVPGLDLEGPARAAPRRGAQLNPPIFREYDIRGIAERDFDAGFAALPRARLRHARGRTGREARGASAATAGSPRTAYAAAVRRGHPLDAGVDVLDLGVVPTPLVYFAIAHWRPRRRRPGDRQPQPADVQRLQDLPRHARRCTARRSRTCAAASRRGLRSGSGDGTRRDARRCRPYQDYVDRQRRTLARPIDVVVDAGNGTARSGGAGDLSHASARGHARSSASWTGASRTTIPIRRSRRTCRR